MCSVSLLTDGTVFRGMGTPALGPTPPAHRLDEFPAGYSLAGCSPALPASASPTGHQYAVMSSCRSRSFHRAANCVLTVCVIPGGKPIPIEAIRHSQGNQGRAFEDCVCPLQAAKAGSCVQIHIDPRIPKVFHAGGEKRIVQRYQ